MAPSPTTANRLVFRRSALTWYTTALTAAFYVERLYSARAYSEESGAGYV